MDASKAVIAPSRRGFASMGQKKVEVGFEVTVQGNQNQSKEYLSDPPPPYHRLSASCDDQMRTTCTVE